MCKHEEKGSSPPAQCTAHTGCTARTVHSAHSAQHAQCTAHTVHGTHSARHTGCTAASEASDQHLCVCFTPPVSSNLLCTLYTWPLLSETKIDPIATCVFVTSLLLCHPLHKFGDSSLNQMIFNIMSIYYSSTHRSAPRIMRLVTYDCTQDDLVSAFCTSLCILCCLFRELQK